MDWDRNTDPDLVSVVIPAYHCSGTIGKTLDSLLLQKVPMEILIIDDASGEDLERILESYRPYLNLRYIQNSQNMGAAASRNRGVALARGRYVAFLDADDWWGEGKLEKQLNRIRETGTVLCSTARELVTAQGELTGRIIPVHTRITYRQLLRHNCINCSSVLLLTEVAREFPMEHEDSHEDYITWLRILRKYKEACAINEPLLKYRLSSQGKSGSKLKSARMTFQVYRYLGFSRGRSAFYFCLYAANGIRKYAGSYLQAICGPH